jgi:hypothetical protein
VSLYPSITRPFDAPEFLFTVRCKHPARGHCFARVSYTVSTLPFWPNFGDFTTPRFTVLQSPSVVSIPTRGWASPGGSVLSEAPVRPWVGNPPRTGISKPLLCFLCYEMGHFLAECPRFPSTLQREAAENRAAFQRSQEAAKVSLTPSAPECSHPSGEIPPPLAPPRRGRSGVFEVADPAPENLEKGLEFKRSDENPQSGSENLVGGN